MPRCLIETGSPVEGGFMGGDALHNGVGWQAGEGAVASHHETDVVLLCAGTGSKAGVGRVDVGVAMPVYRLAVVGGVEGGRSAAITGVVVNGDHDIAHAAIEKDAVEMDVDPRIGRTTKCAHVD